MNRFVIDWSMVPWDRMDHWHWWIVAVVLVIVEVITPAFFFLWLGVSALFVGGLVLIFPHMGWKIQWLLFSGSSLISLGIWHLLLKHRPTPTDRPTLNRRSSRYVGKTMALTEAMVNGMGRVRVEDSSWQVAGPDAPLGSIVRVIGVDGIVLLVELVIPKEKAS